MIIECAPLPHDEPAAALPAERDLAVVARITVGPRTVDLVRDQAPDVVVVDVDRCALDGAELARRICEQVVECQVLVLTTSRASASRWHVPDARVAGLNRRDAVHGWLAETVRQLAAGRWAAGRWRPDAPPATEPGPVDGNPLTPRQREVLRLAAAGVPATDIGQQLFLSPGTVRNYLSAAIRKTGSRNLLDAIRLAQRSGWL